MTRFLLLVHVLLLVVFPVFGQEPEQIWQWQSDADIGVQTLTPSGDVFVISEKSVTLLSAATGKVIWSRSDVSHKGFWNMTPSTPLVSKDDKYEYLSFLGPFVRLESRAPGEKPMKKFGRGGRIVNDRDDERLLLISLDSGKDVLDTWALGIKPLRGTCLIPSKDILIAWGGTDKESARAFGFDYNAAKILWTTELPLTKEISCMPLDDAGLWIANGRNSKGKRQVFGIESSSGRVRWESADLGKKNWSKTPLVYADDQPIGLFYADKTGPIGIDLQTGSTKWQADAGKDDPGGTIIGRANLIFVANGSGLVALDRASGAVKWRRPQNTRIIETVEQGLLVESPELRLLKYENGDSIWSAVAAGRTMLLQENTLYHVSGNKVQSVDIATGTARELGTVEFSGGESPSDLDLLDDAVVVSSSQNIAAFERAGRRKFQQYYEAPGLSAIQRVLSVAVTSAASFASFQLASQRASAMARDAAFVRGGTGTGIAFYRIYSPNFGVRYRATTDSERYRYVYTERPDTSGRNGFSIVRIDKSAGSESGRVWSKERSPKFIVDPKTGRVYMRTMDDQLTAYAFPERF